MAPRFYVETLGCPKNAVDSDKVVASLLADGLTPTGRAEDADLIVVNTCAFVEAARQESIDVALALADAEAPGRPPRGHRLHGRALRDRAGGRPARGRCRRRLRGRGLASPRSSSGAASRPGSGTCSSCPGPAPDRAVGVREGGRGLRPGLRVLRDPVVPGQAAVADDRLDRSRGARRSSTAGWPRSCSSPRTSPGTAATSASPVRSRRCCAGSTGSRRSGSRASASSTSTRARSATRCSRRCSSSPTVVPYFDLSLQHASAPLLRSMKRWGSGDRFADLIARIRADEPQAAFRSSFIVGFPGETETDHDELLELPARRAARLGRLLPVLGRGRHARGHARRADPRRARGRAPARVQRAAGPDHAGGPRRARRRGDRGARRRRSDPDTGALVGRTHREAPEIDGIVRVTGDAFARPGALVTALVTDAEGPDLVAARRPPRSATAGGIVSSPAVPTKRFGPGAVATPANFITIAPAAVRDPDADPHRAGRRRPGSRSRSGSCCRAPTASTVGSRGATAPRGPGAFLDPLADKFLTIGGFVALRDAAATSGGSRSR